jgi:hypothetical protein
MPHTPQYQIVPFQQWEPQAMRFVTSYSLQDASRGKPQIAVFQVIPGEEGRGVRLIVNETPYTGPAQSGQMIASVGTPGDPSDTQIHFIPAVAGSGSFVLADRLAYCRFWYLEPRPEPPFRVWRPDWVLPRTLPMGIRIDMATLDPSHSDLHVSTITTALNVNLSPGMIYADRQ